MISCFESRQEKWTQRANPKGCNKQKHANSNRYAPYLVFDSSLSVRVASKASMPDSIVCSDHSHLMQIFVSFFDRDVNWDVFNDFSIDFHVNETRSNSTLSSLKRELFFLLFFVVFAFLILFIRVVLMLRIEPHRCVNLICCVLSHIYVRVIALIMLVQIRIISLSRTYCWHCV